MDLFFIILTSVLYAAACFLASRSLLHMMQLGSYQLPAYFRAIARRKRTFVKFIGFAVSAALVIYLCSGTLQSILLAVLLFIAVLSNLPRKAKKPLVFTSRLVRMFIVAGIMQCAGLAAYILLNGNETGLIILAAVYALTVFVVMFARLITAPIDYASRRGFINDAKRILRSMPDLKIVGITGSFGKTSVKHYLHALLSERFETLMTPGSFNTPMGVVRTIREQLRPTHEIFICEMGARHVGDIKEICDIVHPDMGIVTSIGEQHLETFKSFENIRNTKLELFDSVSEKSGVMLINGDSDLGEALNKYPNAVTYGMGEHNKYRVRDIRGSESGMRFTAVFPDGTEHIYETAVLGTHSAVNILGAIAMSVTLGIDADSLRMPVKRLKSVAHRLELVRLPDGAIIDDSFNSNPTGSRAAVETLQSFDGFRILITPGMVELGDKEEELNRKFGTYAAKACDHVFLVGKTRTRPIYDGLRDENFPEDNITVTDTFNEAMAQARMLNTNGKRRIILIENDLPDNY